MTPRLPVLVMLLIIPAPACAQAWLPRILLHLVPADAPKACLDGALDDCRNAMVRGEISTPGAPRPYYAFVLGSRNAIPDVSSFEMRIRYDGTPGKGVDVLGWTTCSAFDDPEDKWPASNGANRFWFPSCPGGGSSNGSVVAGYFYLSAYSPDTLRAFPSHGDISSGEGLWYPCTGASIYSVPAEHLGYAVFSGGATSPGCSPCLGDCQSPTPVQSTTWSRIKTISAR